MAKKLKQLEIGTLCPVHLHLDTVLGTVIGFVSGMVVLRYQIKQLHADGWHVYTREYYRDKWQTEMQYNDWLQSS